jgi:ATP-dependent Clp protease adaptor protein ClpS
MANTQTATKTKVDLAYPQRYNVIFLNDDFTPMAFVIHLLIDVFNKNIETAEQITQEIHHGGRAVVGTYSLEVAEQKTHEAVLFSRHAGHPLEIIYEPV